MGFSSQLSPTDLKAAMTRLRAIYGLKGAWALKEEGSEEAKAFVGEWYAILKGFGKDEVSSAVRQWIEDDKDRWPNPGELRRLVFESRNARKFSTVEKRPEWYHEPTDWFAFPVTPQDTEGPRYRLQLVSLAHAKGLALVEQVECPIEGCHCWAREVKLSPTDHGLSSHFASDRALSVLSNVRPTGWRWAHTIKEKQLEPV